MLCENKKMNIIYKVNSGTGVKIFLFLILAVSSCVNQRESVDELAGTYYGLLPCEDCPGVSVKLEIGGSETFTLQTTYIGKEDRSSTVTGKYSRSGDSIITLESKIIEQNKLMVLDDQLFVLGNQSESIQGEYSDDFILWKDEPERAEVNGEIGSTSRIYDFKGSGNEPFWNVNFNFAKNEIHFNSLFPSEPEFTTVMPEITYSPDYNSWSCEIESGENYLLVDVDRVSCQDNMSGQMHDYKVEIKIKTDSMDKMENFAGCGNYRTDYLPLSGQWKLIRINDRDIMEESGSSELPYLLFEDGNIRGKGICNTFNSMARVDGNSITFGDLSTTKMSCPGIDLEQQFFSVINGHQISYFYSGKKLVFTSPGNRLVFEH